MGFTPCPVGEECSAFAYRFFGDCVCDARDLVSFLLGCASIFFWGVAEVPQIIANWKQGHSEGVSLLFILTWTVGDILNLTGCLMSPVTLPTQFYTAVLYTATTLVLVGQHVWYTWLRPPPPPKEEEGVQAPLLSELDKQKQADVLGAQSAPSESTDAGEARRPTASIPARASSAPQDANARGSHQQHGTSVGSWRRLDLPTSYGTSPRLLSVMLAGVMMTGLRMGGPVLFGGASQAQSRGYVVSEDAHSALGRRLLESPDGLQPEMNVRHVFAQHILETSETEFSNQTVALILGWGMTFIYLMGRLPQIILNIQRGSVEGLSFYMFAFAIAGNATYLGSILVRSLDWDRIHPNLPWIVDAACCLLMDFFILCQFLYYKRKCKAAEYSLS